MLNNVLVYTNDGLEYMYEDCKAGIATDHGALLVSTMVPDVSGKSPTGQVEKLVALFHSDTWSHVEFDVCSEE